MEKKRLEYDNKQRERCIDNQDKNQTNELCEGKETD